MRQPALPGVIRDGSARAVTGVLLLAHGGQPQWNERVVDVARRVNEHQPAEVAFGMATRANIQSAVDKLIARGVTEIVAVPLFVSSHSSVITSTEYLLGLRNEAPTDLAMFAKMNHASHGACCWRTCAARCRRSGVADHDVGAGAYDAGFQSSPMIGAIAADRARSISTSPPSEAVILVAHGPVPEDDNRRWLEDMAVLAGHVAKAAPFASVEYMTVRDDAGPAIRDAATNELRDKVRRSAPPGAECSSCRT